MMRTERSVYSGQVASHQQGRPHSPSTRRRVLALMRRGLSISDIQRETGVTRPTLYRWAEEAGIKVQKGHKGSSRIYDREAIRRALKKKTVAEVCEEFGCSEAYARSVRLGVY